MHARCHIAVFAIAVFGNSPLHAQEASSCPVPLGKQIQAIGAFAEMLPVFRHPRCMNCHGGLDIMSEAHPGADQIEPVSNPLDNQQCFACHDGLLDPHGNPGWRQPGSPLFFVGKDDEELCLQMKDREKTGDQFVEHIFNDHGEIQFIAAGFAGDRALGEGLADYSLVVEKPPGTQADLTAKARRWVDLLGEGYSASPECGCVLKLEGKFTYTDFASGLFSNGYKVTADLVWKPEQDGKRSAPSFGDVKSVFFRPASGEVTVEMKFRNMGLGGPAVCEGEGRKSFTVEQLTPGALRYMLLEIAADGRYKVTLVIPDNPDSFPRWEFASTCKFPTLTAQQSQDVRYVSVILGRQEGTVDDEGIRGRLPSPIRRGPREINGEWSFTARRQ
jgi:hypothetical protein